MAAGRTVAGRGDDGLAVADPPEPTDGTPGALVLISDVACPWATVVVLRLRQARARLASREPAGAALLPLIHLAHPLELLHRRPLARRVIDGEIPLCAAAAPELDWSPWQGRLDEYPVSSLLAVEAVQAARRQSEAAAEELDLALRTAMFVRSRCITLRHEIMDAAGTCPSIDVPRLALDLDHGTARLAVTRQATVAADRTAGCTGYLVLPDGSGRCNPGVETAWLGPSLPRGVPQVVRDDPSVYDQLVARAAAPA